MHPSIIQRSGILSSGGCDLYYEVTGEGPPMVFAHGLGGNYLSWWQQIPHFSRNYTCITFSHRGFWPSVHIPEVIGTAAFADDLAVLIDHLQLREVILVAQSMGGWTCLEYALRNQDRVQAIVMSSTTGAVNLEAIEHPDIEPLSAWVLRSERSRKELSAEALLPATGKRMAVEQPALYYLYCRLNDLTPQHFREKVRATIRSERTLAPQRALALTMPILFITGSEDVVFPPLAAQGLAAQMPNARYQQVSHAGHSVYFEHAALYNQLVDAFLVPLPK